MNVAKKNIEARKIVIVKNITTVKIQQQKIQQP